MYDEELYNGSRSCKISSIFWFFLTPTSLTALGGVLVWIKRLINKLITSLLKLFEDEHSASPCLWLFGCFGLSRISRREEKWKRLWRVLSLTSTELVVVFVTTSSNVQVNGSCLPSCRFWVRVQMLKSSVNKRQSLKIELKWCIQ